MHTILVVDDERSIRELCEMLLDGAGYEVRTAEHGAAALRLLDERAADLVVCDLVMPEKEGLETIPEIRRRWPDTRILAMSGGSPDRPAFLSMARHLGAIHTLAKPFSPEALLAAVAIALDAS